MTGTRGIAIVVLIAVAGLAIAPLAAAGFSETLTESAEVVVTDEHGDDGEQPATNEASHDDEADHGDDEEDADTVAGGGSSPGTNVSEFMQSSSAETETTVETGLFNASYNNADNESREAIVTDRADAIENQIADLEDEKDELRENEDEMSSAAYNARMTRLAVQINSLEHSIETVEQRAVDTDLNASSLDKLRSSAEDLSGPSVAEVATNLVGIEISNSISDGIQERVSESTPSPDLDPENLTDDSVPSTESLSDTEASDDPVDTDNSSEVEPDEDEVSGLVDDEIPAGDEIDDEERVANVSEDVLTDDASSDDVSSEDVVEGEDVVEEGNESVSDDGVLDDLESTDGENATVVPS